MVSTPKAALLFAIVSAVGACSSPSAPTPQPQSPSSQLPQPDVSLALKGRIVDDLNTPISGVTVALHASREVDPLKTTQTTTDANGVFDFTARVRADLGALDEVPIVLSRVGYESAEPWIAPNSARTIAIYPVTSIRSGSTLVTRVVAAAPYSCGFESHRCRRILLEPAGETLTVEITAVDGEAVGLVDDEPPLQPFDYARAIDVGDGELFVIGGPATVTLRARRAGPADPLAGQYALTLVHDCAEVPEDARTRRYTATIEQGASGTVVTLSGAQFLDGSICTLTASRLGCNQFLASREQDHVRFDLINADEWHGGYITERVPPGTWLEVFGSAVGTLDGGNVSATGTGASGTAPATRTTRFPVRTPEAART